VAVYQGSRDRTEPSNAQLIDRSASIRSDGCRRVFGQQWPVCTVVRWLFNARPDADRDYGDRDNPRPRAQSMTGKPKRGQGPSRCRRMPPEPLASSS